MTDAMVVDKDPGATLPYTWDWSEWLGTDTIASHTVTAPAGITMASSSATTTAVTAWLTGGTGGKIYDVVCQVTTARSKIDQRTMRIRVVER